MECTYEESLAEAYKTIEHLEYKDFNKISKKFIEFLDKNMDINYYLKLVVDDEFLDNKISEKAKEIIALIYRDYLVSEDEKIKLINEEVLEEKIKENEIRERYNPDNIFKNKKCDIEKSNIEDKVSIVEYKETILRKFLNKIKNIFHLK